MYASLLTIAGAVALVQAQNKPTIDPRFDFGGRIESDLRNHLSPTHSVWDYWGAGWIPQGCRDWATGHGLSPRDFTVFNVHYDDCPEAWVFCRHKDAHASEIDMIDIFGRMPVHMRSYVRTFIGSPGVGDGAAAWTWSNGDVVVEDKPQAYILAHEFSHSMDWHALPQYGSQFSASSIWQDNFNQDKAVVSDYARTNWLENFAETGIIGLYDKVVPGGIGTIQPHWNDVFHQYATYQGYLGDNILPGGTCRNRFGNAEIVSTSNSAKFSAGVEAANKPDVSFKSNVTVIHVDPKAPVVGISNKGVA